MASGIRALACVLTGLVLGCGAGSEPPPEESPSVTASAGEELTPPPPAPAVPEVRSYRAFEESGWLWLDLASLRSMDGWDVLSGTLREALPRLPELAPLLDTRADPLTRASSMALSVGGIPIARVSTLVLDDPSETSEVAEPLASSAWVPVSSARMASLSEADDAPTVAVDAEDRLVVATAGYMRGALRDGATEREPYWEPATVLIVELRDEIPGASLGIQALRIWAARSGPGELRVVGSAPTVDPASAEAAVATIEEKRRALVGGAGARVLGLDRALAEARIEAVGSEVRIEATITERQALFLLARAIEALSSGLAELMERAAAHR